MLSVRKYVNISRTWVSHLLEPIMPVEAILETPRPLLTIAQGLGWDEQLIYPWFRTWYVNLQLRGFDIMLSNTRPGLSISDSLLNTFYESDSIRIAVASDRSCGGPIYFLVINAEEIMHVACI
jgi:hypothetical protein